MDQRPPSPSFLKSHFIDIHEVLPEEDEEEEEAEEGSISRENPFSRTLKINRKMKRSDGSFNRQVSLETGFSVLKKESKAKDEKRVNLPRSGRSFGGFDSSSRLGMEARKGDFSIFKTKSSTLSKQNSVLPPKKERDQMESQRTTDGNGGGLDESVNHSVPAGRYFAALRGPELDQVKVTH